MKKLLIAFLAGAMLIGVGLGVTALEVSEWDVVQHPYYLEKEELQTYTVVEEINPADFKEIDCYVSHAVRQSTTAYEIIEIIEDAGYTDTIKFEIDYRGQTPENYCWSYDGTDENGKEVYTLEYVIQPGYNQSLKVVRNMVEQMFKDKIFYIDNAGTLIEAVRVYTATPEKIHKIH